MELKTLEITITQDFYEKLLEAKKIKEKIINHPLEIGEYIEVAFIDFSLAFQIMEEEIAKSTFPIENDQTKQGYL
jgi:hypothetical protein